MVGLIKLADRIERLDRPDSKVDAEIASAFGLVPSYPSQWIAGIGRKRLHLHAWRLPNGACVNTPEGEAPAFTDSIDAATTLIPDGWDWCMGVGTDEPVNVSMAPAMKVEEVMSNAVTPALAIVAASLRARAKARSAEGGE